ncbi:MAG: heterodisulfide reductase subunit A [Deltaproteobacteria bacterium CG1_02_45_11]|nr:MAG: heterodisulfide reductase subunit A [Deltaproteobacteria bacterium CG1_02_45_11]
MEKKVGVYICTGCKIGGSLDISALSKVATSEYKVPLCKDHPMLCGKEGSSLISSDIEKEGVNTVVIAACSPREKIDVFSYDPTSISLERVNLREHVIWCHTANDEDTQILAEDYMRMGIAKAQKMAPLEPFSEETNKTVLVVGGGITGMTSALEAVKAGYDVVLVEKAPELGGWMKRLWKQYPKSPPYLELQPTGIEEKIKEVTSLDNIKVYTGAKIEKTDGGPGLFDVTVSQNGKSETLRVGAIVEATGWQPYDATKLDSLGFGNYSNVVTGIMVEEMAAKGKFARPSDGKEAKSVAFIQCAGSRDEKHLPYCSSYCCLASLKQAKYIRENDSDAKVYIIYKDIRTLGQNEIFYKKVQEDPGIFLTKGEVVGISEDTGNSLVIDIDNTLLGEKIQVKAEMVVLATGMVPTAGIEVKEVIPQEEATCEEKKEEEEELPADTIIPSDILNLEYRQGPELPALRYGFPDSHYICFPYETRRTGIYTAGCVRQPMDSAACLDDAVGAALKAIQCVELTAQGKAVHPRAGDLSYPELYMSRCTQCKRCTEECPFGMYNEDEKANPLPNLTRCRRCGICMGSCPERIISFKDYSVDIISSMLKAIEVPEEDEEKPRILAFLCENDAYPALDIAGRKHLSYNPYVRVIPLRCMGNVNLVWITDALSKGIDGVILIGCKSGDDFQCHFIKGSELADYRMGKIKETLDRLHLEAERIRILELSLDEYDKLPGIFDDFLAKIEEVGPNPFKGL